MAGCGGGNGGPEVTGTYEATAGGETIVLKIMDDGTYELTIGGKTSKGAATKNGDTWTLTPTGSDEDFTVTVSPQGITGMDGTITFTDGNTQEAPGDVSPKHTHNFNGAWKSDAAQHWKECPDDGAKAQTANHTFNNNSICTVCGYNSAVPNPERAIEMVRINGGTFTMGSPAREPGRYNDETQHSVTLSAFYMSKYLVTQAQYEAVMETNPSYFTDSSDGDNPANRPVEDVKWYDALVFCNKLSVKEGLTPAYSIDGSTDPDDWGDVPTVNSSAPNRATWNAVTIVAGSTGYRLPTEAQWEYACRAGKETAFNWGTDYIDDSKANYRASYVDANNTTAGTDLVRTTEVGSYAPNDWGLYDMHGNVWEWCWDRHGSYASRAQTDPAGAVSSIYRVLRCGGWSNHGLNQRSAYRHRDYPYAWNSAIGFRLVRP